MCARIFCTICNIRTTNLPLLENIVLFSFCVQILAFWHFGYLLNGLKINFDGMASKMKSITVQIHDLR